MIVRCGKCRAELDLAGAGEFLCPRCGTRNVVRGPAAPPSPFDLGGIPTPTPPGPSAPIEEPQIKWISCPSCRWRFVVGVGATEVVCPTCRSAIELDGDAPKLADAES